VKLAIVAALLLTGCAQLDRVDLTLARDDELVRRESTILTRLDRAAVLARIDRLEWQLVRNHNIIDRVLIRDQLDKAYAELRELGQ